MKKIKRIANLATFSKTHSTKMATMRMRSSWVPGILGWISV